jgi:hypothetical protein
MELDWRNRCVGGERLEDLLNVVRDLGTSDMEDFYDRLWDEPELSLPFHRALLRVTAELLWARAARLRPSQVVESFDLDWTRVDANVELLSRTGIELSRADGAI